MNRKPLAIGSALAAMAFLGGFVALDLYLWPQLRWPAAVLGGSLFGALVLLAIGAVVFHAVNQTDQQMEAKGETQRRYWREALARALRHD